MEINNVLEKLPPHLMQFVIDQPYNSYTWQDQAVWRYVMKRNYNHLKMVAHESYIEGLIKTGIEVDHIANMYGMNRILEKIGWAAAAVDGFIPPGAFMEFQAYKVLVIAADIRTIEHIEYTPAPDIIHESAGHAPIIANSEYSEYLVNFGKAGSKAFSSKKDYELYEAIRHLSIIKEDPSTSINAIKKAEDDITEIQQYMGEPSEMSLCRNLHWWTVEYGLIGSIDKFKIYGAGLLSSIGESKSCLDPQIKKIAYSIKAKNYNYDITKPQPQLFVTPNFKYLSEVLEEFTQSMSWKRGGIEGILKAIESKNTATCVVSSGASISGTFNEVLTNKQNQPIFIKSNGPTALALDEKELLQHNKNNHKHGYYAPIGRLKEIRKPLEEFSNYELNENQIKVETRVSLKFESGIRVEGYLKQILRNNRNKIYLMDFQDCVITLEENQLFMCEEKYSMVVGEKIVSVFSGAADVTAFMPQVEVPREKTHKIFYDSKALKLHDLYGKVRKCREARGDYHFLTSIFKILREEYPKDWLLSIEILELIVDEGQFIELRTELINYLEDMKINDPSLIKLIDEGLKLILPNPDH